MMTQRPAQVQGGIPDEENLPRLEMSLPIALLRI
jgi:hypothetical protein